MMIRAIALIALPIAAYLPAIGAGFVWDDVSIYVVDNPLIHAADGLYRFWFTSDPIDYFPLTYTTFWLEWRLWGDNPVGYHVVNIVLHGVVCVLVWRVLHRLGVAGGWFAALLFAVHPVNVEAVAWVTQRKSLLAAAFGFAALLSFLRFDANGRRRSYVVALLLFILSLCAKPSLATLPLLLPGIAWWKRGRVCKKDLLRSLPFLAAALVIVLVGVWFQYERNIKGAVIRTEGPAERLAIAGRAVWFYLSKALVPENLTFVYPRWRVDAADVGSYLPLAVLLLCFGVLWRFRATWGRPLLAALVYYAVTLLPGLGFADVYFWRYSLVGDHYQYQSLPAVLALVVAAASWFAERRPAFPRRVLAALGGIACVWLGVLTWRQCGIYRDEETLWRDTLNKNAGAWIAHNNLGVVLIGQGRLDEAAGHFDSVLRLKPDHVEAVYNLGNIAAHRGDYEQAGRFYREALSIAPTYAQAHNNLGSILYAQGDLAAAEAHIRIALKNAPEFAGAYFNMGNVRAAAGQIANSLRYFREGLRLDPNNVSARVDLARILGRARRWDESVVQLSEAVRRRPDDPGLVCLLGDAYAQSGKRQQARIQYERALDINPGHALARQRLDELR